MRHDRDPPRVDFGPVLAQAEALAHAFAATAAHHDATGDFPFAHFDALFAAGLLGLVTPAKAGGIGGGLVEAVAVVNAIARGEPSTALVLAMHYCQHFAVARGGVWPPDLAARVTEANRHGIALLNAAQVEPGVGSPSHGGLPETLVRRDGDEWVLTGRKLYTTGIPLLRWAVVSARTDEAEPRLGHFLVPADAEGVSVEKTWNATGMRATNSHDLVLRDVRLPLADAFDLEPAALGVRRDPRMGVWYVLLIGAVYDGVAKAARDWLVDFSDRTVPGSLGAPLSSLPRFQDGIGRIELLLASSRRLLRSTAEDFERGEDVFLDAAAAKHAATEHAIEATSLALELAGNPGLDRSNPLERHHRDALCARAHGPQNNLIRTMLSRRAFEAAADAPPERRLP